MSVKHFATAFCIIAFLATIHSVGGEIYRVVDDNGKVTFTDQPPAEKPSEPLKLPTVNTQRPISANEQVKQEEGEETLASYQRAEIISPSQDETVPPGHLDVVVQVGLEPELKPEDSVILLLDGEPYGEPAASTDFVLTGLYRGAHQVQAQVIAPSGEVLIQTQVVTFHVKRHSIQHGQ